MFYDLDVFKLNNIIPENFKYENFFQIHNYKIDELTRLIVCKNKIIIRINSASISIRRRNEISLKVIRYGYYNYYIPDINDKTSIFNAMMDNRSPINQDRCNTIDDQSIKHINDILNKINEIFK